MTELHYVDSSLMPDEGQIFGATKEDRKYKCDICDKAFTRRHNLKSHRLTHTQERPFVCDNCGAKFRRQHDLKRHYKLHTGERPYKCNKCGRRFARSDALDRHMRAPMGCNSTSDDDDEATGIDDQSAAIMPAFRSDQEYPRWKAIRTSIDHTPNTAPSSIPQQKQAPQPLQQQHSPPVSQPQSREPMMEQEMMQYQYKKATQSQQLASHAVNQQQQQQQHQPMVQPPPQPMPPQFQQVQMVHHVSTSQDLAGHVVLLENKIMTLERRIMDLESMVHKRG